MCCLGSDYCLLFCCIVGFLECWCTATTVRVLRNDMSECATGELGNIVVKLVAHCCIAFIFIYG